MSGRRSAFTPNSYKKNDSIDGFRYINNSRKVTSIPNKVIKIKEELSLLKD